MEINESSSANDGMVPQTAPVAIQENPQKKRGFWRRTRQVVAWVILFLLFFCTAGLLLIQLPVFKRFAVNQLTDVIEKNTNGTLTVGEVKGNLLEGFVMNDVTLRLKTGTSYDTIPLVHADKLIANYSIPEFIRSNEIVISSLVLQNPVVHFVKFAGDTTWNYMRFSKPSTTAPQPFNQIVDVASFKIQNGKFYARNYNDSSAKTRNLVTSVTNRLPYENDIDWSDMEFEGIDLDSKLYLKGASRQTAKVNHLGFREKKSGFYLQHLEFSGSLDSSKAKIDNAKITTAHSSIGFSVDLAKPGLIQSGGIASMQHSNLDVKLNCPVVGTNELQQFFPKPLGFLAGSPGIILNADGEFGNLRIKKLTLDFKGKGSISIAGAMKNLHNPDSLSMNLNLQAHELSNSTLAAYVPGLHLPDLSRFGNMSISNLSYNGEPLNFHATFDARSTGAGDVSGNVVLDLRNHNFKYAAGVKTDHFNLAAITPKPDFESSITVEARLAGNGTNWKILSNETTLKTDAPSTFGKYRVNTLDLSAAMKSGIISTDHLDADVDGGPEAHIRSAKVDLVAENIPFQFDGTINDFRLAQVLKNQPNNPARVDLDATVEGTAKNFDDLTGKMHARLFDLEYQGHKLNDVTADATLAENGSNANNLSIHSTMADLTVEHRFRVGDLIHAIPEHVNALVTGIENRDFPQSGTQSFVVGSCADSMDFDYYLKIKDLRPLADFLPRTFLLGQGVISGSVSGCPNGDMDITMSGDSLAFILRNRISIDTSLLVEDDSTITIDTVAQSIASKDSVLFDDKGNVKIPSIHRKLLVYDTVRSPIALPQFGEGAPRIQATPTTFKLVAHNISNDPKQVLGHLDATLDFMADSVVRLGTAILYHPKFGVAYRDQSLTFDAATVYNNSLGIRLKGISRSPEGNFDFTLDTMRLEYANPFYRAGSHELKYYTWMNEGASHILLAKNGLLTIDTLRVIHPMMNSGNHTNPGAQRMNFGGTLQGDTVNAWINFPSFRLDDFDKIVPISPSAKSGGLTKFNGKVRDMNVTLSGTLERPDISARLFADSMTYGNEPNQIEFDSNSVILKYRDRVLSGNLVLHSISVPTGDSTATAKLSELRATIDSIPIVISLKHGPEYSSDSASVLTKQISASINTSNFPLDVATPFIPPFSKLQGTGDIHFAITGTRQNIQYTGQATVHNAAFLLASTNMWYLFDGPLSFADNSLKLQNITIHNVDADDPKGEADINGSFNFKGFSIANFDLELHSNRLTVLSNAARQSLGFVYGPVTINTGGKNFRFYNTFDDPEIDGTINIMSANVVFPESDATGESVSNQGIIYRAMPSDSLERLTSNSPARSLRNMELDSAVGAGSVQMSSIDDTLFPNSMKNIYLNDDGTTAKSDTAHTDAETNSALDPSFADKLRMDIKINTEGDATVLFPFNGVTGILGAQLNAELKHGGTLKIDRGGDLESHSFGEFDLTQNSTFRFYKVFNITSGTITFLNDFTDPQIYITAEYIGPHGADQAKIDLTVSGKKELPTITAQNYIQNGSTGQFTLVPEASSGESLDDAIYYLASGRFKYESTQEQAAGVLLGNAGVGLSTSLVGDMLGNFVSSTSTSFAIRSASFSNGNVNLAAQYRSIQIKYGTGGAQNNDFETDVPLSEFIPGNASKDFIIGLQYNQESTTNNALTQQPQFLSKLVWIWHPF